MTFSEKLENYAEVLAAYALNIQEGQLLRISTESENKELALLIAKKAYQKGAKYVDLQIHDPELTKIRAENSNEDSLSFFPPYLKSACDYQVEHESASLALLSPENPNVLNGVDTQKINIMRKARYEGLKKYYEEGIDQSKVHWTVAAAATKAWGHSIFPELSPEEAKEKLWNELFKICRVDKVNPIEYWKKHNALLEERCKSLNAQKITTLHFTGPGTDLKVGLSKKALFKGGQSESSRGVLFEANIPTEECFTTPDYRSTNGKVRATRPFRVNGVKIENLELEFKNGEIVQAHASAGLETFETYRKSDEGSSRLGEVALVGTDSPIFQSGLVFDEILLDENAACHIAIGSAYKSCIKGGSAMSEAELQSNGVNQSSVHTDMMISSPEVNVEAILSDGSKKMLLKNGEWAL